jgi:hypothetical protein
MEDGISGSGVHLNICKPNPHHQIAEVENIIAIWKLVSQLVPIKIIRWKIRIIEPPMKPYA